MFNRTLVPLNILASNGNVASPSFLVPDGSSKITAQFNYSGLTQNTTLTLQQSADGSNFDPVLDFSGNPVTLILDKTLSSATINLVNLLTMCIRFSINFASGTTGSISSVQYLTN